MRIEGGSQVVVVGDVHGQLHDLLFLLKDVGFPCEDRLFVFNGDYVDRGAWGLETFLILLAWKVRFSLGTAEDSTAFCCSCIIIFSLCDEDLKDSFRLSKVNFATLACFCSS